MPQCAGSTSPRPRCSPGDRGAPFGHPADPGGLPGTLLFQPGPGFDGSECDTSPESPEARQRAPAPTHAPTTSGRRLQHVAQCKIERGDVPQAIPADHRQRGLEAGSIAHFKAVDQFLETPSGGFALRRPPIFKKCVETGAYLRFR